MIYYSVERDTLLPLCFKEAGWPGMAIALKAKD